MEALEIELLESICENLKLKNRIPLSVLLKDSKAYCHYDCDNKKTIYFVYNDGYAFATKRISEIEVYEEIKKAVLEVIEDVYDIKAILKSDFKNLPEYKDTIITDLSDSSNAIILDIINKDDRLREEVKIVINKNCRVLNEELNELKYNYYDITKSNDEEKIEEHRLKIVEKENEVENYMIALQELNSII